MDETTRINRNNRCRGKAFERRVVAAFNEAGFKCRRTPFSGASVVYGKGDVEFLDGSSIFVECKNYKVDLIAMLDVTRFANLMQKAFEQAGAKITCIATRTTKGNNIVIIQDNPYIDRAIRWARRDPVVKILYGGVWFWVLPLEDGVKDLATAYLVPNQDAGIG
jgi:Holliday junction resolvase